MILPILLAVQVFTGTTDGAPAATAPTSCHRGLPIAPEALVGWIATGTGTAIATTCPETAYDSFLTVNGLAGEVACSDDLDLQDPDGDCSTVTWQVTAGSVWAIGVSGYKGRSGPYTLHVDGPGASAGCTETGSPTPTLKWGQQAACPCTLAPCSAVAGYRLTWSRSASGPWLELVRLPCIPAFTDEDGFHPRWCWGVDRDVPVSRWLPPTVKGTGVFFRVEALSSTGKVSCTPAVMPPVCWPEIREVLR